MRVMCVRRVNGKLVGGWAVSRWVGRWVDGRVDG